jgi:hypothetical protein
MENIHQVEPNSSFVLELNPGEFAISVFNVQAQSYIRRLSKVLESSVINAATDDQAKIVSYVWSHEAKDVSILIRDCMLNLLRLKYFEEDGLKSAQDAVAYKSKVAQSILEASKDLDQTYKKIVAGEISIDAKWIHEINPTDVIIGQLNTIIDQIKKINRSQHKLDNIAVSFAEFNKSFGELMEIRNQRSKELHHILGKLIESINAIPQLTTFDTLRKLAILIDNHVLTLENQPNMPSYDSIGLDHIDKLSFAVSSEGGRLKHKQIDILSEVSSWTTFNLSGPLRDIDKTLINYKERIAVALMQLSNRLKAKDDVNNGEPLTFDSGEISNPIQKLNEDYNKIIIPEVHDEIETLRNKLDNLIKVTRLFDEKYLFLPVSKISQLSSGLTFSETIQKRYNLSKIIAGFHQWSHGIFTKEKIKEKPTAASYIDSILNFNPGSDENALFMRKGFLGSSFNIERPIKEKAIKKHFELWQSGFGGSLLITGSHLSGKSSLLELIPIQQPEFRNYNITLNQSVDINGHKINIDTDLIKALKEIVKYIEDDQCIITIDNLEHYASDANGMYDFFNALQFLIIKYSQKIYFAVAIEEGQYHRLKSYFNLENVFSETVNADGVSSSLIEDALHVRALAVADLDEATFNSDKLRQKAKKIAGQSQGNIGLAMQRWCSYDSELQMKTSVLGFKDKVLANRYLLGYLLSFELINMSRLKMFFDEVEFKKVRAEIEHLCQQKILLRKNEGNLQVQPYLRAQIHQILSQLKSN